MKRTINTVGSLIGFGCIFLVILLTQQSCNEGLMQEDTPSMALRERNAQDKLRELSVVVRTYARSIHRTNTRSHEGECTMDSLEVSSLADSVFVHTVDSLFRDIPLNSDLSNNQLAMLALDEDSIEYLSIEPSAFLSYSYRCKTPTFCSILHSVIRGAPLNMSIDDIVSNTQLAINEKVTLVIAETMIEEIEIAGAEELDMVFPAQLDHPVTIYNDCMRAYSRQNGICQGALIAAVGVSVGMAVTSGGYLSFLTIIRCGGALWSYYQCLRYAKIEYENCLYRNGLN